MRLWRTGVYASADPSVWRMASELPERERDGTKGQHDRRYLPVGAVRRLLDVVRVGSVAVSRSGARR